MENLLNWFLTDKKPGFYDCESGTAIEQTARVYKAMQELITEYNSWVEKSNKIMADFTASETEGREVFEIALRQEFQDFINVVDLKTLELEQYIKTNLNASVRKLWDEMSQTGEIQEAFMTTLEVIVTKANEMSENNEQFKSDVNTANEQFKSDVNTANEQFKNNINVEFEEFKETINDDVIGINNNIENFKADVSTTINGFRDNMEDWTNEESEPAKKLNTMGNVLLSKTKSTELRTHIITDIAKFNLVKVCIYINGEDNYPLEILCNVTNHAGGYHINGLFLPFNYSNYMTHFIQSISFGMLAVDIEGFYGGYINYATFTDIYSVNAPSGAIDLCIDNTTNARDFLVEIIGII